MTDEEMISCDDPQRQIERLRAIMHRLRAPGGCPWDAEQTHESLISNLLEEAYEVIDTIRRDDAEHMREELGDLLLQVVFHAELAGEAGRFTLDEVAREVADKLVRRHPHVFGESSVATTDAVLSQWEAIKQSEKAANGQIGEREAGSYLAGTGKGLPALLKAVKLQKKAGKVGFDWPDAHAVLDKVDEESGEIREELHAIERGEDRRDKLEDEIGDLLFIAVNVARKCGIDPEVALSRANSKFERRFAGVEDWLSANGLELGKVGLDVLDAGWEHAKSQEKR